MPWVSHTHTHTHTHTACVRAGVRARARARVWERERERGGGMVAYRSLQSRLLSWHLRKWSWFRGFQVCSCNSGTYFLVLQTCTFKRQIFAFAHSLCDYISNSSVLFSSVHSGIWYIPSVQFSSRWYLCGQKSPYALHPVSQTFPQRCLWNSSNVRLINDGPPSSFQGISSSASSWLYTIMNWTDRTVFISDVSPVVAFETVAMLVLLTWPFLVHWKTKQMKQNKKKKERIVERFLFLCTSLSLRGDRSMVRCPWSSACTR